MLSLQIDSWKKKEGKKKKYTTSINNLSTTIGKLKTIRLLKLHIVNHTSSYLNENPHTSYLVEEFRFNDAIQLLEAPPDPFPGPRPMYAISVGLSGSGNILLKDLGRADGIDALLTICKNISQKIVTHIDQRDFFFFFFDNWMMFNKKQMAHPNTEEIYKKSTYLKKNGIKKVMKTIKSSYPLEKGIEKGL